MGYYRLLIILLFLSVAGVFFICILDRDMYNETGDEDNLFSTSFKNFRHEQVPRDQQVTVNLSTNKYDAESLHTNKNEDNSLHSLSVLPELKFKNVDKIPQANLTDLQRVVKNMMDEGIGEVVPLSSSQEIDGDKYKFRSHVELKEILSRMDVHVKTESEFLQDSLSQFKKLIETGKDKNIMKEEEQILTTFEYLVHQIDNGDDFITKMNGYESVVLPSLNSTHYEIRVEALRLLAAAAQNNPEVQSFLTKNGAVSVLLKFLDSDPSPKVKTSSLYALSCLIRGFPAAQRAFIDNSGLSILTKQFQCGDSECLKRQLKAVTLIKDLLEEAKYAREDIKTCEDIRSCRIAMIKASEYNDIALNSHLEKVGWCEILIKLLKHHSEENEVIEEITQEMQLLDKQCAEVHYKQIKGNEKLHSWLRNPKIDTFNIEGIK